MSSVWLLVNSDTPAAAAVAKDLEIAAATLNFKFLESRTFWMDSHVVRSRHSPSLPGNARPAEVSSPGAKANTLNGGRSEAGCCSDGHYCPRERALVDTAKNRTPGPRIPSPPIFATPSFNSGTRVPLAGGHSAFAETYPDRPIQLLVPFSAGSVVDVLARGFADALSRTIGGSVIVSNQEGASGIVALSMLANARPDGYTLGFAPAGQITIQPHLKTRLAYKADRSSRFVKHSRITSR